MDVCRGCRERLLDASRVVPMQPFAWFFPHHLTPQALRVSRAEGGCIALYDVWRVWLYRLYVLHVLYTLYILTGEP